MLHAACRGTELVEQRARPCIFGLWVLLALSRCLKSDLTVIWLFVCLDVVLVVRGISHLLRTINIASILFPASAGHGEVLSHFA